MDENFEVQPQCDCIENDIITLDPIMISTDNLDEVQLDEKEFQRGLKDISYVCGMLTGLMNIGLTSEEALSYIIDIKILENNIEVAKINKEASVNVAKETTLQIEKNSL